MSTAPVLTNPEALGTPLGLYSHVSRAGDTVYVAGQVGIAPDGELAGEDVMTQTRQAFANIRMALESEGMGLANIARMTTYLVDPDDIARFYQVRAEIFPELFPSGKFPPNTLLVINRLVKPELRIEVDVVAYGG